jgi:1-pyrroline-5-carboxylate dehydrogenase
LTGGKTTPDAGRRPTLPPERADRTLKKGVAIMQAESKITYATLTADNEELQAQFDAGIARVKAALGRKTPLFINGRTRDTADHSESRSPIDTRVVVARVGNGTVSDVNESMAAAKAAFPAWSRRPWRERATIITRAAQLIRERRYDLSAWLIYEMGKNRLEALGEVEETADLFDYYVAEMQKHDGYVVPMNALGPNDRNTSVLRPYGVWGVISPFNFPYALLAAPIAAALLAGNTVVAKPSSETPLTGVLMTEILLEAGLPAGTLNLVTGDGKVLGTTITEHPDLAGLTFTGSYEVGFKHIYQKFGKQYPRPCIVEMGGKNPAIVMDSADLDRAVLGVHRSAFGMNGHKCSACSRVYVHEAVAQTFIERLAKMADEARIGDPLDRHTFVGPVATKNSHEDYKRFVAMAREANAIRTGGALLTDGAFAHGYYVRPTVLTNLPRGHQLWKDELFVPIVAVERVTSLDEALELANDTHFGLTAGIFTRKQDEIDAFLDRIQAGVVYVNRAAGATTGAWPGVQPFGGWKGSGSTGKNIGGVYTLPCYLREQSRTVVS